MPQSKYSKIKFSDLTGKRGQIYYDGNNRKNFLDSEKISIDFETNRIKLADGFSSQSYASQSKYNALSPLATHSYSNRTTRNFLLTKVADAAVKLYYRSGFGAYSLRFTFPFGDGDDESIGLISFRRKIIAFTALSGVLKVSYSTNNGSSFTHANWDYAGLKDYAVGDDGYLYVVDVQGKVIRTDDGIVWELYYDGSTSEEKFTSIENLDGFLYGVVTSREYSNSYFCRIERDDLVYLHNFDNDNNPVTIKKFSNRLILSNISDKKIEIYEYDKGDVKYLTSVDYKNYISVTLQYADKDFLYFSAADDTSFDVNIPTERYLFAFGKKNGIYYLKDFGDHYYINQIIGCQGRIIAAITNFTEDPAVMTLYAYDNGAVPAKTATSGSIELPTIAKKHKPCYLIARHKKLGANATLTVKIKKDGEATFATTVINNTTDNSLETIADLKSHDTVYTIQIEITLAVSTPVNGIEDLELIYLFLPMGLEYSK